MSEVEISTRRNAAKRQEQIRHVATTFAEAKAKLIALVQEAKESNDHLALGYASWTAYLADTFGDEPLRLARDDRQDMVRVLAAEGMSTRAIAPIVGASHMTVSNDLAGVKSFTPAPRSELDILRAEATAAEASLNDPEPPKVTGLDGKTYARPTVHPAPRAEPITDQFTSALTDLNRAMNRIHRITENAHFERNSATIRDLYGNDLRRTVNELQAIIDNLQGD